MYRPILLTGIDSNNNLTLAKFASSYSGSIAEVVAGTVLGVGLNSSGLPIVLKLSSLGEFVS